MRWADFVVVCFGLACTVVRFASGEEPSLKIKSRSSVFNIGEKKAIFCEGTGVTEPIEWYTPKGEKVQESPANNKRVYKETKILPQEKTLVPLFILNFMKEDNGNWTCRSGDLEQSITFTVGMKVILPQRSENVTSDEGRSITLHCEAKGDPEPVVQWYLDNQQIKDDPEKYVISRKEDQYNLQIKNLQHNDAGAYQCTVMQESLSHFMSKTINLEVKHRPIIYDPETNEPLRKEQVVELFAVVGDTKNITCNAVANPPPVFRWFKVKSSGYQEEIKESDLIIPSETGLSSTYILRMNSEEDSATYRCTAKNPKGTAIVNFDVTPARKPDPPSQIKVVAANASHITFNVICGNCTLKAKDDASPVTPDDLPVDGYWFHIITDNKEFVAQDWTQEGENFEMDIENVNVTIFPVGPLPNQTVFHARVRSRNAAGFSDWLEMPGTCQTSGAFVTMATTSTVMVIALLSLLQHSFLS